MTKLIIIASVVLLSLTSLSVLAAEKLAEAKVGPAQAMEKGVWGGAPPQEHSNLNLNLASGGQEPGRSPASEAPVVGESTEEATVSNTADEAANQRHDYDCVVEYRRDKRTCEAAGKGKNANKSAAADCLVGVKQVFETCLGK